MSTNNTECFLICHNYAIYSYNIKVYAYFCQHYLVEYNGSWRQLMHENSGEKGGDNVSSLTRMSTGNSRAH